MGALRLHKIYSDGMVLQRNSTAAINGWAENGDTIVVDFLGRRAETKAAADGKWHIDIATGDPGGPYDMTVSADQKSLSIVIHDIMLGDVWLCSGQSNIAVTLGFDKTACPEEPVENRSIRLFHVQSETDFAGPRDDFPAGSWISLNAETQSKFTAIGYWFAREIFENHKVPIGLVSASMGGCDLEAFMSEESLTQFPEYSNVIDRWKDPKNREVAILLDKNSEAQWRQNLEDNDSGLKMNLAACAPDLDTSSWSKMMVPSNWEDEGVGSSNGVLWLRREIFLPASLAGLPGELSFGHVIDENTAYLNGTDLGTRNMQWGPSIYQIPPGVLREGKNIIVIRAVNPCENFHGGFYKGKKYALKCGDGEFDLTGPWPYYPGFLCKPLRDPTNWIKQPIGLYNAMLTPLNGFPLKGVLWYQGESNSAHPDNYESLMKAFIGDLRANWGASLYFLLVQLPNYEERYLPGSSGWPAIREAQRRCLSLPDTAMAITIDIGEWNDVHPKNKREVGHRLALAARSLVYGEKDAPGSGPLFLDATREENRLRLTFSNTHGGLKTKDGEEPRCFEIAGNDKRFLPAHGLIEGSTVVIWHEQVSLPVYTRYAWAGNPVGANLYNGAGLPASPFCHRQNYHR